MKCTERFKNTSLESDGGPFKYAHHTGIAFAA